MLNSSITFTLRNSKLIGSENIANFQGVITVCHWGKNKLHNTLVFSQQRQHNFCIICRRSPSPETYCNYYYIKSILGNYNQNNLTYLENNQPLVTKCVFNQFHKQVRAAGRGKKNPLKSKRTEIFGFSAVVGVRAPGHLRTDTVMT